MTNPPPFRRLIQALVGAGAALLALAGCADSASSSPIRIGFLYDVHAANIWTIDQCKTDKVTFELFNFKQFAEVQRALQDGQIDAAAMGYQNLAQMIEAGYPDFRVVAGVYTGAEHITVGVDSGITTWADLKGKKVGIPPNSFVEMLFRSALAENNVDIEDITLVPFPGAGPPMLTALQNKDIDAMVAWEPNSAQAKVQGIGEYPSFDIQQGSIGDATSALYVSEKLAKDRPESVQELVRCVDERTKDLTANKDEWVRELISKTGLTEEVAKTAIETGEMDTALYPDSAKKIIKTFAENGIFKDSSDQVPAKFDSSFLDKITGKSASALGQRTGEVR